MVNAQKGITYDFRVVVCVSNEMRGKGTWTVREIWEFMGMAMLRCVVVSVVFLTALAAIDSDWKLPSSHLGNAAPFYLQKTGKHKVCDF